MLSIVKRNEVMDYNDILNRTKKRCEASREHHLIKLQLLYIRIDPHRLPQQYRLSAVYVKLHAVKLNTIDIEILPVVPITYDNQLMLLGKLARKPCHH